MLRHGIPDYIIVPGVEIGLVLNSLIACWNLVEFTVNQYLNVRIYKNFIISEMSILKKYKGLKWDYYFTISYRNAS